MKQKRYIIFVILVLLAFYWPVPEIRANHGTHVGGTINTSETWTFANSPYIVTSDVFLATGGILTIEAGVVVKFEAGKQLHSGAGTIIANGTASSHIIFTSIKDDTVAGDTNGDGDATFPASDDWVRIVSGHDDDSITYAEIRHATICIEVTSAAPTIQNNIIQKCGTAIKVNGIGSGSTVIQNNIIKNNTRGLHFISAAGASFSNNDIYGHTEFGAKDEQVEGVVVNANGNWWGHVNGPCLPPGSLLVPPACTNRGDKITSGFTVESFLTAEVGSSSSSSSWTPPFSGGGGGGQNSPASTPPRILKLEASASSFKEGEEGVVLSWETKNAEFVSLLPELVEGPLSLSGSLEVRPEKTTTYKLIALGPGGETQAELTVEVLPRDPVVIVPGFGASIRKRTLILEHYSLNGWNFFGRAADYKNLIKALESAGYKEGINLFVAHYDWRKDNNYLAKFYLKPRIQLIKEKCGCEKVDIVAHSMGGLVSRAYIQSEIYENDIDQLIMLGTPNYGASPAYLTWEGGELPTNWNRNALYYVRYLQYVYAPISKVEAVNSYIKSVGELIPVYDFLVRDGKLIPNQSMVKQNQRLQKLNEKLSELLAKVKVYTVGGTDLATYDKISVKVYPRVDKWWDGIPDPLPPKLDSRQGDGTVLANSALLENSIQNLLSSDHQKLLTDGAKWVASQLGFKANISESEFILPPKRELQFLVASPADIKIRGPFGEKNFSGIYEDQQDGNVYYYSDGQSDGAKLIIIEDPPDGQYEIELVGNAGGQVHFSSFLFENNALKSEFDDSFEITVGKSANYTLNFEDNKLQIKIHDLEPPVSNLLVSGNRLEDGMFEGLVGFTIQATDNDEVDKILYSFDSNNWSEYQNEVIYEQEGEGKIYYRARDTKGNQEEVKSFAFKVKKAENNLENVIATPSKPAPSDGGVEGEAISQEDGSVKGTQVQKTEQKNKRSNPIFWIILAGLILLTLTNLILYKYARRR